MRACLSLIFCAFLSACAGQQQEIVSFGDQTMGVGPTRAITSASAFIGSSASQEVRTTGRPVNDLSGYSILKQSHPELFAANGGRVSLQTAEAINAEVNEAISYKDDPPGITEVWHVMPSGGEGNCHDYAATKLAKMVAAGTPRSALRFVVATVKDSGIWHLMLAVDVPGSGTFFMDSNRKHILTAAEARDLYTLWFMENPAAQRLELVV